MNKNGNKKEMNVKEGVSIKAAKGLMGLMVSICFFQMLGFYSEASSITQVVRNGINLISDVLGWAAIGVTAFIVFLNFSKRAWVQIAITVVIGGIVSFLLFNLSNIKTWGESLGAVLFN